ncbi:hypothetical protein Tco_0894207, partial [Tanacetum coccineum]
MCDTSSTQLLFSTPNLALMPSPRMQFALSTCPLVYGCLTDANLCLMFNFSHQSLNGLLEIAFGCPTRFLLEFHLSLSLWEGAGDVDSLLVEWPR